MAQIRAVALKTRLIRRYIRNNSNILAYYFDCHAAVFIKGADLDLEQTRIERLGGKCTTQE